MCQVMCPFVYNSYFTIVIYTTELFLVSHNFVKKLGCVDNNFEKTSSLRGENGVMMVLVEKLRAIDSMYLFMFLQVFSG